MVSAFVCIESFFYFFIIGKQNAFDLIVIGIHIGGKEDGGFLLKTEFQSCFNCIFAVLKPLRLCKILYGIRSVHSAGALEDREKAILAFLVLNICVSSQNPFDLIRAHRIFSGQVASKYPVIF